MAYWSIALLLLSVSFLAYRHPPTSVQGLPQWMRPAKRRLDRKREASSSPPDRSAHNGALKGSGVNIVSEDDVQRDRTPKARASEVDLEVPSFELSDDSEFIQDSPGRALPTNQVVSSLPEKNGAPRASAILSPTRPTAFATERSRSGLMAPPPRPTIAPPPSSASALRVPSTGPLPNRGPPANSQQRASGGLTVNGTSSIPNTRGKVLLSPGHSPMDWAALTRKTNLSGVGTFQRVTPSMLKSMTGRKGKPAWSSWQGKVYNITPYLPFHPGGESEIMKAAGRDGTKLFLEVHPWVNWENMLGSCLVGVLVPEDYGMGDGGEESLEDMD